MAKSIEQQVVINADPARVYETLMDSKRHGDFTGGPAEIDARVGGTMSCHGGWVTGVNVDLVKDQRIVQAWRGKDWPAGVFSVATFSLQAEGKNKTKLSFTQHGVPDDQVEHIAKGWYSQYWEPLAKYLAQ
ncbi:MAG TPA: SRPBCC domain-containing protein [Myxococcales bacterium]|jgi:activator of HSP90 ATPase|nr:SRPBCC domain-containing protein [Myxococcales bacterium]